MLLKYDTAMILAFLCLYSLTSIASAHNGKIAPDQECNSFRYSDQDMLHLARITKNGGAQVYWGWLGCGSTLQTRCKEKISNEMIRFKFSQIVLEAGPMTANAMCVFASAEHIGMIHRADAKLLPPRHVPLSEWSGMWRWNGTGPDYISIQRTGHDVLSASGRAYWNAPPWAMQYGGFAGTATPSGNHLLISGTMVAGDDCRVRMTRIGKWLVVSDNHKCGAINVGFDGMYWRNGSDQPPPPPTRNNAARLRADAALLKHDIDAGTLPTKSKSKSH